MAGEVPFGYLSDEPGFVEVPEGDGFAIAAGAANGGIKPQYAWFRVTVEPATVDGVEVTGVRIETFAVRPAQLGQKAMFIHNPDTGLDDEVVYPPIPKSTGTGFFLDKTTATALAAAISSAAGEISLS